MNSKIFFSLLLIMFSFSFFPIFAESIDEESKSEILMLSDKDLYYDNDFVKISGSVPSLNSPNILIGIYDKFGTPTGFYFVDINSTREFSVSFMATHGVNFKTEGNYSAVAHYGNPKKEISFEFTSSMKQEIIEENHETNLTETHDEPFEKFSDVEEENIIEEPVIIEENYETNLTETHDEPFEKLSVVEEENIIEEPVIIEEIPDYNLSLDDSELEAMLNLVSPSCDNGKFNDFVFYYEGMGPSLMRLCHYESALALLDESLIEEPNNIEILINKGVVLSKLGHNMESIFYYDSTLEIDSTNLAALNNKANALARLGDFIYKKGIVN